MTSYLRRRKPIERQANKKFNARWGDPVRFMPTPWTGKEWAIYDAEQRKNVEFGSKGFCMEKARHLNDEHARAVFDSPWDESAESAGPRLEADSAGQPADKARAPGLRQCALLGGAS